MKHDLGIKISGRVIHGDHFGKKLGFPTANLDRRDYTRRKLKIKFGVWSGWAEILDSRFKIKEKYKAGIVIGPTDKKGLSKIEAHAIGFKGNLYGKKVNIYLNQYLRPFRKYRNAQELKEQIRKDINQIKQLTINN